MKELWVTEIFPKTLDGFSKLYPYIVNNLQYYIKNKSMPHLIFSGKEGIGKTHLALAFASCMTSEQNIKLIFASDPIKEDEKEYVKEINRESKYSQETYSNLFVQARIMPFLTTSSFDKKLKIIIIKDFDIVSQAIFRRLLEKYNKNVRFILITKNISNIITPLLSRCSTIFVHVPSNELFDEYMRKKIIELAECQNVQDSALEAIRFHSKKNFIIAINTAQECHEKYKQVHPRNLQNVCVDRKMNKLQMIIKRILNGNLYTPLNELYEFIQSNIVNFKEIGMCIINSTFQIIDLDLQLKIYNLLSDKDLDSLLIYNNFIFFSSTLVQIYNMIYNNHNK